MGIVFIQLLLEFYNFLFVYELKARNNFGLLNEIIVVLKI